MNTCADRARNIITSYMVDYQDKITSKNKINALKDIETMKSLITSNDKDSEKTQLLLFISGNLWREIIRTYNNCEIAQRRIVKSEIIRLFDRIIYLISKTDNSP